MNKYNESRCGLDAHPGETWMEVGVPFHQRLVFFRERCWFAGFAKLRLKNVSDEDHGRPPLQNMKG